MLLQAYDFAHLYRTMGVELQMGGADQWGNITAGLELIRRTRGGGRRGRRAGPRPRLQAAAVAVGHEVRQERGRRVGLARSGADVAVRVLPVLAQHRRPRRRDVPALVHRAPARARSRRSRPRLRGAPGGAAGAAGARARHHRADPRRRRRRRGPSPTPRRRSRASRSTIRRSCASLYEAAGGFTFDRRALRGGTRGAPGRGRASSRRAARRAG